MRPPLLSAVLICLTLVACDDDTDGGICAPGAQCLAPSASVSPTRIEVPRLVSTDTRFEVELFNAGAGPLRIADVVIDLTPAEDYTVDWVVDGRLRTLFERGTPQPFTPVELPGGASIHVQVNYAPSGFERGPGVIRFVTDDPVGPTDVEFVPAADPRLSVTPDAFWMARREANVTVHNTGDGPLQIARATPPAGYNLLGLSDAVTTIEPGGALDLTLRGPDDPFRQTLVLTTNDPRAQRMRIPILQSAPDALLIEPNPLDFGEVHANSTRSLRLTNQGARPLTIEHAFLRSAETPFRIAPSGLPVRLIGRSITQAPDEHVMRIEVTLPDPTPVEDVLVIETDDPHQPTFELPLAARRFVNHCPVAQVAQTAIDGRPLEPVTLDARPSSDPNGGGLIDYSWTLLDHPTGSRVEIGERYTPGQRVWPDDARTPQAILVPDLPGTYRVALTVTDLLGLQAPSDDCPGDPVIVTIDVPPGPGVQAFLVWDSPDDPDRHGTIGGDLDLRLHHPSDPDALVCWVGDRFPDWPPAGPMGDPELMRDDQTGHGGEWIALPEPVEPDGYLVAVHAWPHDEFWPSEALVRLFVDGEPLPVMRRWIESPDQRWDVGHIGGDAGFVRVDRLTD